MLPESYRPMLRSIDGTQLVDKLLGSSDTNTKANKVEFDKALHTQSQGMPDASAFFKYFFACQPSVFDI